MLDVVLMSVAVGVKALQHSLTHGICHQHNRHVLNITWHHLTNWLVCVRGRVGLCVYVFVCSHKRHV